MNYLKRVKIGAAACLMAAAGSLAPAAACTGISFTAANGDYVQARTIEWGETPLPSEYVIMPRGYETVSYTPSGKNGLVFRARYGVVGLAVVQKEFIAEGLNEAGLSAGLFYFPRYGYYPPYDSLQNSRTLSDLQVVPWILSQFATIDELKAAIADVRLVSLDSPGMTSTVHWRIGDAKGNQVVLEFIDGVPQFYDNPVGVLTNSPGFPWHLTNLNNYVNLYAGGAPAHKLADLTVFPFGAGSGLLGLPGDVTPPSRFVRVAFYKATAPQKANGYETVLQCFHILNNFDIPIGTEFPEGKVPDIPSATQWTSAVDLTARKIYYKTSYNNTIRCIDLNQIDFGTVKYQGAPLDREQKQPIEMIRIGQAM